MNAPIKNIIQDNNRMWKQSIKAENGIKAENYKLFVF